MLGIQQPLKAEEPKPEPFVEAKVDEEPKEEKYEEPLSLSSMLGIQQPPAAEA